MPYQRMACSTIEARGRTNGAIQYTTHVTKVGLRGLLYATNAYKEQGMRTVNYKSQVTQKDEICTQCCRLTYMDIMHFPVSLFHPMLGRMLGEQMLWNVITQDTLCTIKTHAANVETAAVFCANVMTIAVGVIHFTVVHHVDLNLN